VCLVDEHAPFVMASPGATYRALVTVNDLKNGLTFQKPIQYVAPLALPTGIALKVATPSGSTSGHDLTLVPTTGLDRLVTYARSFSEDYVQTASNVPFDTFVSTCLATPKAFPASVVVVASVGIGIGSTGLQLPIAASYNRSFFVYPVLSSEAIGGLRDQLAQLAETFSGRVLTARATTPQRSAWTVLVDDGAWSVLQAAQAEQQTQVVARADPP